MPGNTVFFARRCSTQNSQEDEERKKTDWNWNRILFRFVVTVKTIEAPIARTARPWLTFGLLLLLSLDLSPTHSLSLSLARSSVGFAGPRDNNSSSVVENVQCSPVGKEAQRGCRRRC